MKWIYQMIFMVYHRMKIRIGSRIGIIVLVIIYWVSIEIIFWEVPIWKNTLKKSIMIQDGPIWSRVIKNDPGWSRMIQDDPKWSWVIKNDPGWSRMIQDDQEWSRVIQKFLTYLHVLHKIFHQWRYELYHQKHHHGWLQRRGSPVHQSIGLRKYGWGRPQKPHCRVPPLNCYERRCGLFSTPNRMDDL